MRLDRSVFELEFGEDFTGEALDPRRWVPHYLPHWTTPERSAARYELCPGLLRLRIDADQSAWRVADGEMRVSNLQTGTFSGPVGSPIGQHRHRGDLTVVTAQPTRRLYTPRGGLAEATMRAGPDPTCLLAFWLVGFEASPDECGEICVAELFGHRIGPERSHVRVGVKAHHDPRLRTDMEELALDLDATDWHTYSAEWTGGSGARPCELPEARGGQGRARPSDRGLSGSNDEFDRVREPRGSWSQHSTPNCRRATTPVRGRACGAGRRHAPAPGQGSAPKGDPQSRASRHASRMTDEGLAAFYRRYNDCCNEHRVEDLAQFVARDVAIDGTVRGLDAYAEELRAVVRAFPDYRWELRRLVVDPPWIAAHLTDTGTHRGSFLGVPATGRTVDVPEFAFYRIDAGRIAEVWGSAFGVHLLQQIRER